MDVEDIKGDIAHQEELILQYKRALRILEKQAANYGNAPPVHVQIGIDDLIDTIQICQQRIGDLIQQLPTWEAQQFEAHLRPMPSGSRIETENKKGDLDVTAIPATQPSTPSFTFTDIGIDDQLITEVNPPSNHSLLVGMVCILGVMILLGVGFLNLKLNNRDLAAIQTAQAVRSEAMSDQASDLSDQLSDQADQQLGLKIDLGVMGTVLSLEQSATEKADATATVLAQSHLDQEATATVQILENIIAESQAGSGTVLYEANWSSGLNGWKGPASWKTLNGVLLSDGTTDGLIIAPYTPRIRNYAVEAEIEYFGEACTQGEFGLVARAINDQGYYAITVLPYCIDGEVQIRSAQSCCSFSGLKYNSGIGWHIFRLEVEGTHIRFYFDKELILEAQDNRFLSGENVGLWSSKVQINIRSFRVIKL
jgi:hypothetical protein